MSDKAKFSYLAGIIDGEGCLTIGAGKKETVTNYNSIVMVTNTNEKLIKWLQHNFGGNYYKSPASGNCKPAYRWRFLKHKDTEHLLLSILPYLIIKRQQAITLLEFVRLPRMESVQKREDLYQWMRFLNRRGLDSVTTNMQDICENCSDTPHHHQNDGRCLNGNTSWRMKIESELIGNYESGPAVMQVSQ